MLETVIMALNMVFLVALALVVGDLVLFARRRHRRTEVRTATNRHA